MTDRWHSQLLSDEHELGGFDCGEASLNHWLVTQARRAQAADTARTYVWAREAEGSVVAYYSIAPTQLFRGELPAASLAGGYSVVPAYLLARLALDLSLQGLGCGADLLVDAMNTILQASATGSGRLIIVDAIDDKAASFYRHHDFVPIAGTNRLVMKVATARKALNVASVRFTPSTEAQLGSIMLDFPDGERIPAIVTLTEMEAILTRLTELAELQKSNPGMVVNLQELFVDVLGRDPLADANS